MRNQDFQKAALAALTTAGASALKKWVGKRRPAATRILRGAAAGAGAAALVAALRVLVDRDREIPAPGAIVDALLAGAGKGVIYTAVVDPVLPGPPVARGAMVGAAEYLSAPWGGLLRRLSTLSPVDRIPVVGALLDAGEAEDDPFVAYLLFGIALGLLSGEGGPDDD